ncbi:hypothetical protein ACQ5SO_20910 [Rhodovulum sp. DZ06]|uniref:hypothetical protein n=1 Tax=Rhodovulum sp. DZ06 TaxID=3425126 RepID=UPI003D336B74
MLGRLIARLFTGRSEAGTTVAPGLVVQEADNGGVILCAVRDGRSEEILLSRPEAFRLAEAIRGAEAPPPEGFRMAPDGIDGARLQIDRAGRAREIILTAGELSALDAAIRKTLDQLYLRPRLLGIPWSSR